MLRRQDGQIIPALVVLMAAVLLVGGMLFQVGRASIFRTEAQTAADAAALAAAQNIRQQLMEQVALTGTSSMALINWPRVWAAAQSYARRNGAWVTNLQPAAPLTPDVKVWVTTSERLGRGGFRRDNVGVEEKRGNARARARLEMFALGGLGAGSLGGIMGSGDPVIDDKEWKELAKEIDGPPQCGTGPETNDLVKLAQLLAKHGFHVAENADLGDNPAPGSHSSTGYHYKCRNSAAIDVNRDRGNEMAEIDAIIKPINDLGFRTIWRTKDHWDHLHVDLANSLSIGAGYGSSGVVGALQDTFLDVKLVAWESAVLSFGDFGGGGFYGGPPDPDIARVICRVLDRYNAPPKVRLAAFEAAIVESGVHNLPYGDRDSLGVFQQRPSVGEWGTAEQIRNPEHAAMKFVTTAIRMNGGQSAGQLAQDVQRSAYPDRYDAVAGQAMALLEKFC